MAENEANKQDAPATKPRSNAGVNAKWVGRHHNGKMSMPVFALDGVDKPEVGSVIKLTSDIGKITGKVVGFVNQGVVVNTAPSATNSVKGEK